MLICDSGGWPIVVKSDLLISISDVLTVNESIIWNGTWSEEREVKLNVYDR